jgi:hypothetical protein
VLKHVFSSTGRIYINKPVTSDPNIVFSVPNGIVYGQTYALEDALGTEIYMSSAMRVIRSYLTNYNDDTRIFEDNGVGNRVKGSGSDTIRLYTADTGTFKLRDHTDNTPPLDLITTVSLDILNPDSASCVGPFSVARTFDEAFE